MYQRTVFAKAFGNSNCGSNIGFIRSMRIRCRRPITEERLCECPPRVEHCGAV